MDHKIFEFVEINDLTGVTTKYKVSTRNIDQFKAEHGHEYDYVEDLIDAALAGKTYMTTSRKYSFGDNPEWYVGLEPEANCTDPQIEIEVSL